MMTLALISDIHGNLAALQAVLARLDAMAVKQVVCLGDTAGYYPDLDACADLLRARKIPSLRGNHDDYIAQGTPCPRSDSANRCLDYQRKVMRPDTLDWLRSLATEMQIGGVHLVHAGWVDPLDEYIIPDDAYFARLSGQVFASGHTHVQYIWHGKTALYCNPGSVGQPRDGDARAAFALWDGTGFSLHRVEYDISKTETAMEAAGFNPYFYQNLRLGSRIGGKIDSPPL